MIIKNQKAKNRYETNTSGEGNRRRCRAGYRGYGVNWKGWSLLHKTGSALQVSI